MGLRQRRGQLRRARARHHLAAVAAIELGRESEALWDEHVERIKRANQSAGPPATDDGIERVLAVTLGVSTTIGGEDEGHIKHTGVLLGVEVREVEGVDPSPPAADRR